MAFEDDIPDLNFAGDASLASSPATELMTPGVGDAGAFDQSGSAGLSFKMPSLNLASPPPAQSEQQYLQSLPMMQKIGLALQAFSAGVAGRPSPINELLKRKRQQDKENRDEIMNTINVISKGSEILRKLPHGIQRDAVASELGKAVGPKYADVFKMVGSERDDELKSMTAVFSDPDVQNTLIKACTGTPDFGACWRKQANDETFMKRAFATADAKQYEPVTKKLAAVTDQLGKSGLLSEFKNADGKYEIPFAKMVEFNAKAKIFTDTEMDFIRRNDAVLEPFGIKSAKAMEAGAAERAKQAEKPVKEWSEPYMLNGALVQKNAATGEIRTAVSRAPEKADKPDKPLSLAQERHDEQVLEARLKIKGMSKEDMLKKRDKDLPNGKPNPDYDPDVARNWRLAGEPLFADVKAKRDEAKGKPKPEAAPAPAPAPKPEAAPKPTSENFNLASWEKTKKIHGLTDAELEKRLGRKKPVK